MKTGADLVNVVCLWVDNKIKFCSTVIIAFDTYQEISLKSATRNKRYSKSNLQHYNITSSTNISRQSLSQLAHKKSKRSLIELLTGPLKNYLSRRGLRYHDHSTHGETTNNHQEADTLLIIA